MATSFVYLSVLAVITVGGLVAIAALVMPRRLRWLSVLFVVPLVLVKVQPQPTYRGSITALLSAVPARTLLLVLTGLLLIALARSYTTRRLVLVGLFAGAAALNNVEFGVPVLLSAGVAISFLSPRESRLRHLLVFLAGAAITPLGYLTLLTAIGRTIEPSYWLAFVRLFGEGFGAMPMPVVGPHIFVAAVLLAGVGAGASALLGMRGDDNRCPDRGLVRSAGATALYFGLAGLGSFGYYAGRSVVSGQLQIFLIYIAPIIATSLVLFRWDGVTAKGSLRDAVVLGLVLLPAGVAVGSVVQAPDARFEWHRIARSSQTAGSTPVVSPYVTRAGEVLALLAKAAELRPGVPVSSALSAGIVTESLTGLPSISPLDHPADARKSALLTEIFCTQLRQASGLVIAEEFLGEDGTPTCAGFRVIAKREKVYILEQGK